MYKYAKQCAGSFHTRRKKTENRSTREAEKFAYGTKKLNISIIQIKGIF
jgi:hypothetical protein